MGRLFLRVYLKLLLSLGVAGVLVMILVLQRGERSIRNGIEEVQAVPVALSAALVGEALARDHAIAPLAIERIAERFGAVVALVPEGSLPLSGEAERERLARGEAVVRVTSAPREITTFARVEGTSMLLRVGPLAARRPSANRPGEVILLLLLLGLWFGVYTILVPIQRGITGIADAAEAFGRGDLAARAAVGSRDSLGDLAGSFNRMAGDIQRLLGAQRELLRVVSHELRTPLQRLQFTLEAARDAGSEGDRAAALDGIERDLDELGALIEELLTYGRVADAPGSREPVALGPIVAAIVASTRDPERRVSLAIRDDVDPAPTVGVESRLIRRAIENLVTNGLRYARSRVEIAVRRDDGWIRIDVDDDGLGVPEADRERVFEPFQRLDDEITRRSRGSGLGLAIVRAIAERHDGRAEVSRSDLGGARFRVTLPDPDSSA